MNTQIASIEHQNAALTAGDVAGIADAITNAASESTRANYRSQWLKWSKFCQGRQVQPLPAGPELVAAYLVELSQSCQVATLRLARAAIAKAHQLAGLDNPTVAPVVVQTLKGIARESGTAQRQAQPLDSDATAAIVATARIPRTGRRGSLETAGYAELRGQVDIALVRTMFDGLLRRSEAAALRWADISRESDGSGRMLIARSKTDQDGAGAVLYLSRKTMAALDAIRPADSEDSDSVFGLSASQIGRRIGQAARAAGLGDGFTGHSPRVGMAQTLARANIELPAIMQAGRWQSPSMPARYIRNEAAGRGAVAQLYRRR